MTIVEDSANQFYSVVEIAQPGLEHAWLGVPVKRVKGEFVPKAKATPRLIRKFGCRVVSQ